VPSPRPRPMVIGVGAPDRSDDGVGIDVVRSLGRAPPLPVDLVEESGDATRLLDRWEGRELVILVDAVRSGAPPGTVHRWGPEELAGLPLDPTVSTHGLSLANVLRLARDLGRLPARVVVYGIEAGSTEVGEGRSPPVRDAVPQVCQRIADEVAPAPLGRAAAGG
jgi:hydrogenase maturation protease